MTNFDRFLTDSQFTSFAEVAVSAEKIYPIDPAACVLNCRRSMEFAVKWMYSVDGGLVMPYDDRLVSLMDAEDFRDIVGEDLWRRLKYIRQTGNTAAHSGRRITAEQAALDKEKRLQQTIIDIKHIKGISNRITYIGITSVFDILYPISR